MHTRIIENSPTKSTVKLALKPSSSPPIYIFLGYFLFALFLLQYFIDWKIEPIYTWQQDQMYKRWSGCALLGTILFQWGLSIFRMLRAKSSSIQNLLLIHQWLGAFSPVLFFIHTMNFGFGYLLVLSIVYYFNFILGLLNVRILKSWGTTAFRIWYVGHLVASILILCLAIFHAWMVFYYE